MPKHCPICNRSSDDTEFYGEFCEHCTLDRVNARLPKTVRIVSCKRCGRIRVGGEFTSNEHEGMESIIRKEFKGYSVKLLSHADGAAMVEIGKEDEGIEGLKKKVGIEYDRTLCSRCGRVSSGYYEAVFQLRGNPERVGRLISSIGRYLSKNDEFIAKVQEVSNGYDVYISNKKLAGEFILEHRLKPTVSYTLYGMRKRKKVYRNTYSIHL